ncbi:MAG: ferritin-like domain-containing protein [Myxococcota bacterium]|nr:ferritin-like domain-containing protein [Myxococcota bacterium]
MHRFETDTLLQAVFKDGYELEADRLESLYSKSKRHQWNAELDVDWRHFDPEADVLDRRHDFLSRLTCVNELPEDQQHALFKGASLFLISQVLHGEQAALMTCGQLVNCVPDMDGKFGAAVQVMDEARHVEVFARYLDRHGRRYPIDPDLQSIVQALMTEADWEAKCVGMQVILESVALSFFRLGERIAVEPLLKQFIGRVHEDESRHVAYGVLTLEERIPQLSKDARVRLENWAYDAIAKIGGRAGKPAFQSQAQVLAETGIDLETFLPRFLAEVAHPEDLDLEGLSDPMTATVIPNLLRVGLVPERLLPGYLAQGFQIDLATRSVRDVHTFHPDVRAMRGEFEARKLDFSDPLQVSQAA